MLPVVSVVIPTYKHAEYVLATLESVFAQTFTSYEVIVVNDGSPDDTAAKLRPLADAGRIRYFEQPNAGQSAARNRGLAEARGEFVAFLDDDDLWPPEKLSWQVAALREDQRAGVVYGQKFELGGDEQPSPGDDAPVGDVFARFAVAGWIQSPGQTLIRREVLSGSGGFDPAIWGTDDWDLWLRLARKTRFCYRPLPALYYRRHATNASKNFVRMWKNGHAVVRKNLDPAADPEAVGVREAAMRFVDRFALEDGYLYASQLLEAGQFRKAATALWQIWRIRRYALPGWHDLRMWGWWVRGLALTTKRAT